MSNVKIENTEVYGFQHAIRNMRNPKESWHLSDSGFFDDSSEIINDVLIPEGIGIGPADLELLLKLVKGGSEHRKVLRTIGVWLDLTVPLYVHVELDTYKIGTVRNSCSTMHKLGHRDLVPEDFATTDDNEEYEHLLDTIRYLNDLGRIYREGGKKDFNIVKRMKRNLPTGMLQKIGFFTNYECLLSMFYQRRAHRLDEWRFTGEDVTLTGFDKQDASSICNWIAKLPYMDQIIKAAGKND